MTTMSHVCIRVLDLDRSLTFTAMPWAWFPSGR